MRGQIRNSPPLANSRSPFPNSLIDYNKAGRKREKERDKHRKEFQMPGITRQNIDELQLRSNEAVLDSNNAKWLHETPSAAPMEEMQQRFRSDGYLLVKGLLPRQDVLDFRAAYFKKMHPLQWCGDADEGQFVPGKRTPNSSPEAIQLTEQAHLMPEYLALSSHPALLNFIASFEEWNDIVLLKRNMLRPSIPGDPATRECESDILLTAAIHYDNIFLRGGDPTFLTAWVPLGDIDPRGGGLMYLEDSIDIAKEMEAKWQTEAQELSDEERKSAFNVTMKEGAVCAKHVDEFGQQCQRKWLVGGYEAGDVMFHNAFMIHASCTNQDPKNKIRLATDLRFCDGRGKVDQRWLNHWHSKDGL